MQGPHGYLRERSLGEYFQALRVLALTLLRPLRTPLHTVQYSSWHRLQLRSLNNEIRTKETETVSHTNN